MSNAIVETETAQRPIELLDWQLSRWVPQSYIRDLDNPSAETPSPFEYAFHLLNEIRGKTVVTFGCGDAASVIALGSLGARVTAIDSSADNLRRIGERASANRIHTQITLIRSDAVKIPVADGVVDRVFCAAELHCADCVSVGRQIRRILKPGGSAVFVQPTAGSGWLGAARCYLLRPGSLIDHHSPLTMEQTQSVSRAVGRTGRQRQFKMTRDVSRRLGFRLALGRSLTSLLVWEARKES
jgi:SAM-dependent methyltransferase